MNYALGERAGKALECLVSISAVAFARAAVDRRLESEQKKHSTFFCTIKKTPRNGQDHDGVADRRRGRPRAHRGRGSGEERGQGKKKKARRRARLASTSSSSSSSASRDMGEKKLFLCLLSLSWPLPPSLIQSTPLHTNTTGPALWLRQNVRRPDHRRGQGSFFC